MNNSIYTHLHCVFLLVIVLIRAYTACWSQLIHVSMFLIPKIVWSSKLASAPCWCPYQRMGQTSKDFRYQTIHSPSHSSFFFVSHIRAVPRFLSRPGRSPSVLRAAAVCREQSFSTGTFFFFSEPTSKFPSRCPREMIFNRFIIVSWRSLTVNN